MSAKCLANGYLLQDAVYVFLKSFFLEVSTGTPRHTACERFHVDACPSSDGPAESRCPRHILGESKTRILIQRVECHVGALRGMISHLPRLGAGCWPLRCGFTHLGGRGLCAADRGSVS